MSLRAELLRDLLKAAVPKYVDAVYEELPGALSTEQRAKKLAAIDKEIATLDAEIGEIENEYSKGGNNQEGYTLNPVAERQF